MQEDRLTCIETLGKVFTCQKLLDGEILPKPYEINERKFAQPFAVVTNLRLPGIEHAECLLGVGLGVVGNLLLGQDGTRFVFVRRIANERSVTTNEEGDIMSQILELAQL